MIASHIVLNLMNMPTTDEKLGNRLRLARKAKGLTQLELATLLDVDQTYLSKIENGHATGSVSVLKQAARNLGITIAQLHGESKAKLGFESMTVDAVELARDWQKLPPAQRDTIRATVDALLKQKASRKRKK